MKKLALKLALLFSAALLICSCNKNEEYPMFWTWLEDIPSIDMESAFTHMEEAGLDAVMLHAPSVEAYKKDVEIARRHGIKVYAWVWTLNPPRQERAPMLEEHPDWFSVNRNGESVADHKAYVNSYKFLCPAIPEVREYLRKKVEDIVAVDGVEGICLDYCRLIDCVLPISLAYNYNLRQDTEVWPEYDYGYHPAMLEKFEKEYGYDPRDQEDPSRDEKWCEFRCDQVTDLVNEICAAVHAAGKKVSADVFPGPKSHAYWMVRQEWNKWDIDMVFPMNYNDFYLQPAEWVGEVTEEEVKSVPGKPVISGLFICREWKRKVELEDPEQSGLIPAEMATAVQGARQAGAAGICLFTPGSMTPEHWEALAAALK